jgi:methyl-accepting chemotaxis protein
MGVAGRPDVTCTLEKAGQELRSILLNSAEEMDRVGRDFEDLAHRMDVILNLAAEVIGCVEDERVSSILSKVQTLGTEAKKFIQERLLASGGILEIVTTEAKSLAHLSQLTRSQRSIARETQMLSVLTNIEVARLGDSGVGFEYLAHQLDDFSQSVAKDTKELTSNTDKRKVEIEETRRMLGIEEPRMREEFAQIEADLGDALAVVDHGLTELSGTPARFRSCVEEISGQIAGVVAAVQANDITRQQLEHVCEALRLISDEIRQVGGCGPEAGNSQSRISAGLAIQVYQLKSVRATVDDWVSQIRNCLGGILKISSSEVERIGPVVLDQERGLAQQLSRIEAIEQACQASAAKVEETFAALSTLMQLVSEHLEKSRAVRDRLQVLTFNSIIEASHLGTQADAILEISQSIKRISAMWSEMTEQSGKAKEEILGLVEQAKRKIDACSEAGRGGLQEAQAETRAGLENLRAAAVFASKQATEIEDRISELQARIATTGSAGDRLDACFAHIDTVLGEVEESRNQFESDSAGALGSREQAEVEAKLSPFYTTEIEREVMRAALCGAPLPEAQQIMAGNDVELF